GEQEEQDPDAAAERPLEEEQRRAVEHAHESSPEHLKDVVQHDPLLPSEVEVGLAGRSPDGFGRQRLDEAAPRPEDGPADERERERASLLAQPPPRPAASPRGAAQDARRRHCTSPFVSRMNAVSRFTASSWNCRSRKPWLIRMFGRSV